MLVFLVRVRVRVGVMWVERVPQSFFYLSIFTVCECF